jgi:hypothetical protein
MTALPPPSGSYAEPTSAPPNWSDEQAALSPAHPPLGVPLDQVITPSRGSWWGWKQRHSGAERSSVVRVDGFAITSLILGLVGSILFSVGFGIAALRRIRAGKRRGKGLAVAGMSLSLVWLIVAIVLVAFHAGRQPVRSSDGAVTARGQIAPTSLHLGDCVELPRVVTGPVRSLAIGPCSVRHNGQVFTILQTDPGPYPGDAQRNAQALADCAKAAPAFLGNVPSLLHVVSFVAVRSAWDLGDRQVRCLLVNRAQDITGDIRNHAAQPASGVRGVTVVSTRSDRGRSRWSGHHPV